MPKPQASRVEPQLPSRPKVQPPSPNLSSRYRVTKVFPTTKVATLRGASPQVIEQFNNDLRTSPKIKTLRTSCSKEEAAKKIISDLRNTFWKHQFQVWGYNPATGVSEEDVRHIYTNAEALVSQATHDSPAFIQFANQWAYKVSRVQ